MRLRAGPWSAIEGQISVNWEQVTMANKPHVLILGGNFAGLGAAQKIRDCAGDSVEITVIDRKAYLDYIPNISLEIFEGGDPARPGALGPFPAHAARRVPDHGLLCCGHRGLVSAPGSSPIT